MFPQNPRLRKSEPTNQSLSAFTAPAALNSLRESALVESLLSLQPRNHTCETLHALVEHFSARKRITAGELRIGMYDGSFDPPHFGHVEVAHAAKALARLDLLVINCHPKPSSSKPDLSPHELRTEMLCSYFGGVRDIIVSPLSRQEVEAIIRPCRVVGIIGSDTFNRFLTDGIAPDFVTDEIFVAERHAHPLREAPHDLAGRPVLYAGSAVLSFNRDSSSVVRAAFSRPGDNRRHPLINEGTDSLARQQQLYTGRVGSITPEKSIEPPTVEMEKDAVPKQYQGCTIVRRLGLHNGLLSESFVHEVHSPDGNTIAFMKQVPPHRDPPHRDPAQMIDDEGCGLRIFNEMSLAGANAPNCVITESPPSLWVEKAPGKTLSALITGYDRGEESEQQVYEALAKVGEILGAIHRTYPQQFDQNAIDLLQGHVFHHETLLAKASEHELKNLELQEAILIFRDQAAAFLNHGVRCSLLHGDANPGNFLWDSASQQLSVIDLQRLGTQVRTTGPGFSTLEYFSFLRALYHFPNIGFEGRRGGLREAISVYRSAYGAIDQNELQLFEAMRFIRTSLAANVRIHCINPKSSSRKREVR